MEKAADYKFDKLVQGTRTKLGELQDDITHITRQQMALQVQLQGLQKEQDALRSEAQHVEQDLQQSQEANVLKDQRLKELNKEYLQCVNEYQRIAEEGDKQCEALQRQITRAEGEVAKLNQQIEEEPRKNDALRKKVAYMAVQLEQKQQTIRAKEAELAQLDSIAAKRLHRLASYNPGK